MKYFDENFEITDPRMQAAVDELQERILSHFPSTTFTLDEAPDEPDTVYMRAIVDVDDTDEVADIFMDRLVDFQVDENLPIYVVTVPTPERIATACEREREERRLPAFPF